jgi:hypothetical protein
MPRIAPGDSLLFTSAAKSADRVVELLKTHSRAADDVRVCSLRALALAYAGNSVEAISLCELLQRSVLDANVYSELNWILVRLRS